MDLKLDPEGSGADHVLLTHIEKGIVWLSFSAHRDGTNQTSVGTAATKIRFTTELYDTNSDFEHDADDSGGATESRFTPTVAGKYLLIACIHFNVFADTDRIISYIYKNGSSVNRMIHNASGIIGEAVLCISIVDANGTTDYFEVFGANADKADTVIGTLTQTYFMGSRIA